MAGNDRPEKNPRTIIPGSTCAGYVDAVSIVLVRNNPTELPRKPAAKTGFTPIRGITIVPSPMPAVIETPNGRYARPARNGDQPCSCCSHSVSRKKYEKNAEEKNNVTPLVTTRVRFSKNRNGINGATVRYSTYAASMSSSKPPAIGSTTLGEPHGCSAACRIP